MTIVLAFVAGVVAGVVLTLLASLVGMAIEEGERPLVELKRTAWKKRGG